MYSGFLQHIHDVAEFLTNRRPEAEAEQRIDHHVKLIRHLAKWRSLLQYLHTHSFALVQQISKQLPRRILGIDDRRFVAKQRQVAGTHEAIAAVVAWSAVQEHFVLADPIKSCAKINAIKPTPTFNGSVGKKLLWWIALLNGVRTAKASQLHQLVHAEAIVLEERHIDVDGLFLRKTSRHVSGADKCRRILPILEVSAGKCFQYEII